MKYLIIGLISILLISCSKKLSEQVTMLNRFKEMVDPLVFSGVLDSDRAYETGSEQKILYPDLIEVSGYSGVFYTKEDYDSNILFKEEVENLIDQSIYRSKISDSCNFLVPDDILTKEIKCKIKEFPVPNFTNEFLEYKDNLNNAEYFILNTKRGSFFKKEIISKPHIISNQSVDSGYSNGVLVDYDNSKIIFWVIIW